MAGITQRITFSQILLREGNPFCNDKLLECCAGHGLKISTNIVNIAMGLSGDGRKGQITGQILVDIGDGMGDHSGHEHKVMQTAGPNVRKHCVRSVCSLPMRRKTFPGGFYCFVRCFLCVLYNKNENNYFLSIKTHKMILRVMKKSGKIVLY